jgi:hypothetical protein
LTTSAKFSFAGVLVWLAFVLTMIYHHPPPALMIILILVAMGLHLLRDYILSYRITNHCIAIHRPLWDISFSRNELLTATLDPRALADKRWSFSERKGLGHCGRFSSRRLGDFQSFVTDPRNTVVLRFAGKTIVVSPEEPRAFLSALNVPAEAGVSPP